ncbi:MAG TPA: sugar phosphate nucleotidyltransferase [Chthoniobacterales bacterium]|nr:sugar phosphate nucleotidyltransferase [Chthoniobacterales bacterium]
MEHLFIFIMAGGTGERFWPMSRIRTPKHLLRLLGERTLLEEAVLRALKVVPAERVFVLTNRDQLDACREAVPCLDAAQFLAEPAKRDTAPAAALATGFARAKDSSAVVALLPADSMIHDAATFERQLRDAATVVSDSPALLTFSIPPKFAATGYGYLKHGALLSAAPEGSKVYEVERFVEKPDADTAEEYVASGEYGWNAGMFVWRAETFLAECKRLLPPLAGFITSFPDGDPAPYLAEKFEHLPKISVDYAIMEQAGAVVAVEAEFDWDDVGAWTALPAHLGQDEFENTIKGPSAVLDSHNNIVVANSRTIALCGVSDLVVIETADAVLICHRNSAQRIKNLQPHLPEELR